MKYFTKIDEEVLRITPPSENWPAGVYSGRVISFDEKTVVVDVTVDVSRRMEFRQDNGIGLSGVGDFIIKK